MKKVAEPTEFSEEPEEGSGETDYVEADDDDDDEEGGGGEEGEDIEHEGGVDFSSEGEGRQTASESMSTRSESKPYSSVTHKCEVRNIC